MFKRAGRRDDIGRNPLLPPMPARRALLALPLLLALAACSAGGPDGGETSGIWSGTAQFQIDSVLVDQNFHIVADYETRYEFTIEEDEVGLVYGYLRQYNSGTFRLREPRDVSGDPGLIVVDLAWDDDLVQTWPVYGTFQRPELELDLPEAEAAQVYPADLWTFTVSGGRARLAGTRIQHGYSFSVYENNDSEYTVVVSPDKADDFSMERQ